MKKMITILIFLMAIGFFIGLPVAFVLSGTSFVYFFSEAFIEPDMVPLRMVRGADSYTLMAIPLYMAAGKLMGTLGLTDRIFDFTRALVGHFPGGTGYVNILASFIFSGMSGSALADVSGIGSILVPAMEDEGYDSRFASAVTVASSTIGPVFPPSIPMVLIGGITGISVGRLFIGGVIPGAFLAVYLIGLTYFISQKRDYPRTSGFSFSRLIDTFLRAIPAIMAPVIIIGGILGGIFTPTEAGVIAVWYVLFVGVVFYGQRRNFFSKVIWDIYDDLKEAALSSAKIMFIVGGAYSMAWIFARLRIGDILTEMLLGISESSIVVMGLLAIAWLFMGCFLNPSALIVIFVPLIMPVIETVGIDPIYFGVLTTFVLMIGLATPPFGLSMFIIMDIADLSVPEFAKGMLPYYIALVVAAIIMLFIPQLITWLPYTLM